MVISTHNPSFIVPFLLKVVGEGEWLIWSSVSLLGLNPTHSIGAQCRAQGRSWNNILIAVFVYWVQKFLVTVLDLFMWMWYLDQYIFLYVLLLIIFVKVGRGIRIALVIYCVTSVYDMVTPRTMRAIWDMNSVLFSCPGLGHYLWQFINNSIQLVGRTGEDSFTQSFTLLILVQVCYNSFWEFQIPFGC